jgi:Bacteriophage HK97-gp10, putative tail-component
MRVEKHGFAELAADLERAGKDITDEVAKVTGKACNNIKKDAQRRVRGYPHLPHLARSFTYDVDTLGSLVVGEVGAEHERLQGKLDVYIEFGTPTSAPIPHWRPAADKEIPVWVDYLDQAAVDALGDRR